MARYIHCADLHLRADLPLCRMDNDWMETQESVLNAIVDMANKKDASLIIGGDLFDVPRVTPAVTNMFLNCISRLKNKCYIIAGNHSLPWHKQENLSDSSIGIIASVGQMYPQIVYLPCEDKSKDGRFEHSAVLNDDVVIVHTLAFPSEDAIPFGAKAVSPEYLFDEYAQKWILVGDYHDNFVVGNGGRWVINPGCTTIQSANLIDYDPCVYFVDTDNNFFEKLLLPNNRALLTDVHLSEKKERDERMSSFVETLKKNGKVSLSFENNLKNAIEENGLDEEVIKIFDELIQED